MVLERAGLVRRAARLAVFTVAWNLAEGAIAIVAAVAANSDAVLSFGLDSGVESLSGGIVLWRLLAEQRGDAERAEMAERRALKLIGITFFLLAAYVTVESTLSLVNEERPDTSTVGIVLTALSILVMPILAFRKRAVAVEMGSKALIADSHQTFACAYLSAVVLAGLALNALARWWWADPLAALGVVVFLVMEGREAFQDQDD
jgi:divalent metal cation (Fe/Co/Zn/Cd) transporter